MVADVMRRHGHDVVQARGRLGGALFSYGAVFSAYPQVLPFSDLAAALAEMPSRIAAYAARSRRTRHAPPGRDGLLAGRACVPPARPRRRVRRAHRSGPEQRIAGDRVRRRHRARRPARLPRAAARRSARRVRPRRAALCATVAALQPQELARCGLRDGIRRMSLDELVRELLDHDRTHLLELDELLAELELPPLRPSTAE
jgi:hypothetical protein